MDSRNEIDKKALRRRAERYSGKQEGPQGGLPTEADVRRLVHELEVHQIELEMQNIELRNARDEAEAALAKYTDLYDFAPVGYFTLGADGSIRLVNLTGSVLLGVERSKLIGRSFAMLISGEDRNRFKLFLKQVFADEGREAGDFELAGKNLMLRVVNIEARCSHSGPECSVIMVDITARRLAEETSHRSEALFAALVAHSPAGMYVVDSGFRLQQVNPLAMELFKDVHPLIGRNFAEIVQALWPRRIANQVVDHFRHTLESGEAYQEPRFVERRRDTGLNEAYEWQIQRVTLPAGEYAVVCFFNNITDRVKAESAQRRLDVVTGSNMRLKQEAVRRQLVQEALRASRQQQSQLLKQSRIQQKQLRELSHRVLHVQEEERKRVSRELHDVVAQALVGINVHLAALTQGAVPDPANLDLQISRTNSLVEKALEIVHNFARDLRPTTLDDLGLIPALQTLLKGFMEETGIRATLKATAMVDHASGVVRTVLYRVAQEALNNVARHSKASSVEVKLEEMKGIISLEIRDDGQGINPKGKKQNCMGLLGMKERVEMIGGTFGLDTAPGVFTLVQVKIPARSRGLKRLGKKTPGTSGSLEAP